MDQPLERKEPWSPRIYPAITERLCVLARKKGMTVERLTNLYLQMAVAHEGLMEKETTINLLEDVLVKCIKEGEWATSPKTKPCNDSTKSIDPCQNG